jgi:hypothetical protein
LNTLIDGYAKVFSSSYRGSVGRKGADGLATLSEGGVGFGIGHRGFEHLDACSNRGNWMRASADEEVVAALRRAAL